MAIHQEETVKPARHRSQRRLVRRATSITLLAALLAWAIVAYLGYADVRVNAGFSAGILLLLTVLLAARPPVRKSQPDTESTTRSPVSADPDPVPGGGRPKAVTEEYNTLYVRPERSVRPAVPPATPQRPAAAPEPVVKPAEPASPTAPAEPPTRPIPTPEAAPEKPVPRYQLPPAAVLPLPEAVPAPEPDELVLARGALLESTLESCGAPGRVVDFGSADGTIHYEFLPEQGVEVGALRALREELALVLAAKQVRVEAPFPGKETLRLEVPTAVEPAVSLRSLLETQAFQQNPSRLAVALGMDTDGQPVVGEIARMPHLLIEGAGSPRTMTCLHTLLCSLLFKARPDEVKLLLIDPRGKLSLYGGLPHLQAPVVSDLQGAVNSLKQAVAEMEERSRRFASLGVRDIKQYNHVVANYPSPELDVTSQLLPYLVVCVAELADLMKAHPAEVETAICRLAPNAGTCGIHLVVAAETPDESVITEWMRVNIPARITLAPALAGRSSMRFQPSGLEAPVLAQGAVIDDAAVRALVRYCRKQPELVR